ncbi:MAG: hypothetical protein IH851_09920 [Armatimonadetes bacterium]|nr:hypothetical protein [Armatimonadota bacterium]
MQRRGQAAAGGLELLGEPGAGGIERFGETGPGSLALPGKGPEDGVIADPGALGGTAITDLGAYPDTGIARPDAAMPPDIRAWLEHLKRVDRRREALNRELAPKLINLALNLQPGVFSDEEELQSEANRRMNEAQTSIGGVTPGFQDLIRDFQSFAPPQECRRIADEYNALLFGLTDMVQKVTKALEAKDLGSLYTMLGSSYSQIDQRASNANVLVDHLCRRYREPNIYVLFVETQGGTGVGIGMGDIEKLLRGLGG